MPPVSRVGDGTFSQRAGNERGNAPPVWSASSMAANGVSEADQWRVSGVLLQAFTDGKTLRELVALFREKRPKGDLSPDHDSVAYTHRACKEKRVIRLIISTAGCVEFEWTL